MKKILVMLCMMIFAPIALAAICPDVSTISKTGNTVSVSDSNWEVSGYGFEVFQGNIKFEDVSFEEGFFEEGFYSNWEEGARIYCNYIFTNQTSNSLGFVELKNRSLVKSPKFSDAWDIIDSSTGECDESHRECSW